MITIQQAQTEAGGAGDEAASPKGALASTIFLFHLCLRALPSSLSVPSLIFLPPGDSGDTAAVRSVPPTHTHTNTQETQQQEEDQATIQEYHSWAANILKSQH